MSLFLDYDRVDGSGLFIRGLAGEDLGNRKVVYINDDGTWKLADATSALEMPGLGITMHAITSGRRGWIMVVGFIGLPTWTWTAGGSIYVSDITPGEVTQISPANPVNIIQGIGYAESATQIFFHPRQVIGLIGATYTKTVNISADFFGKPVAQFPTVVDQDNVTLYKFTVNTDFMTYKLPVPTDYASGGLKFNVVWTNDGGTDDQNKNVRASFEYQTASEGDAISGSHTNSPKLVADTYESASGWVEYHTDYVSIAEADFEGKACVYVKVSFVSPPATPLSCDPHLIGICLQYTAYAKGYP